MTLSSKPLGLVKYRRFKELHLIKQRLFQLNLTIAVAESLTCGLVQDRLGSVSGSSSYLVGGITAYNIDQKVNLLGVNREHAQSCNCVSQLVADEMAMGVCKLFGADIGIGTTGYAEPCKDVKYPHAFFSIFTQHRKIIRGSVDMQNLACPDGGLIVDFTLPSRNKMRSIVADNVICALSLFLEIRCEVLLQIM